MNCKQIREAIDTASRHNLYGGNVTSHLSDCPDCLRYSDQTTSLLGLLGAQPRVDAPPDFDFRLRARMARAQAATANDPRGFLWKIRPETFSWGQMVATAAALALVVTVSTFYIDRDNRAPASSSDVSATKAVGPEPEGAGLSQGLKPPDAMQVVATPGKPMSNSVNFKPASFRPAVRAKADTLSHIASIAESPRIYSPKTKRLLKYRTRFYGAETASIPEAKPVNTALTF